MTIDEAVHRVVRGHWLLILTCMLLPVVGSIVIGDRTPPLYEALARVQMGRDPAASNVQADATSERVLGIATSVSVVRSALDDVDLTADPATFAEEHVAVRRVGVSSVVEIAVSDTDPRRAAAMASSITKSVLQFSNLGDQQTVEEGRAKVNQKLVEIARQRKALVGKLSRAQPGDVLAIQAQLSALMSSQTEYERQLSELDIAELSRAKAVLLDPVREPAAPLPKDTAQKAVLALFIGTLLGLGLAAARETVHPRLRGTRAIAYALDTPHLGHVSGHDLTDEKVKAAADHIADRVALLGQRYEAQHVFLLPVRDADESWARGLAQQLSPDLVENPHRLPCEVLGGSWVHPGGSPVAVLLVPVKVLARDLEPTSALLEGLGWPLLGVVTYQWPRRLRRRGRAEAPKRDAVNRGTAVPTTEGSEEVEPALDQRKDPAQGREAADSVVGSGRAAGTPAAPHAAPDAGSDPAVGRERQELESQQEVFHR
jgi:capsular polysaccharide biosynthesis protein